MTSKDKDRTGSRILNSMNFKTKYNYTNINTHIVDIHERV